MQLSLLITWSVIGLVLIALSWIEQVVYVTKHGKKISNRFLILYVIGAIFLVIDGFINSLYALAILNLVTGLLALVVLFIKK